MSAHFRRLVAVIVGLFSVAVSAGSFFPPEYKSFPYKEGDLLASQDSSGKFSVSKVLKIDRILVKKGHSINIQGKSFVAPEDDYLLIISIAYGKSEFSSLNDAKIAAKTGKWQVTLGHVPNRPPGAAEGQTLIGHAAVVDSDLVGYREWKSAFDKGQAGVF